MLLSILRTYACFRLISNPISTAPDMKKMTSLTSSSSLNIISFFCWILGSRTLKRSNIKFEYIELSHVKNAGWSILSQSLKQKVLLQFSRKSLNKKSLYMMIQVSTGNCLKMASSFESLNAANLSFYHLNSKCSSIFYFRLSSIDLFPLQAFIVPKKSESKSPSSSGS